MFIFKESPIIMFDSSKTIDFLAKELSNIIENIPYIIDLFVPGYVFLAILKYFNFEKNKEKHLEITIVETLVISYIFNLLTNLICDFHSLSVAHKSFLSIFLAFICGIIVVRVNQTKWFKKSHLKIGKITGNHNIWCDFFDKNLGTRVRFYCEYDNQHVTVQGDIKYYSPSTNDECIFVIKNFEIKFNDGHIYLENHTDDSKEYCMIFNTKDINGLEAHYGKPEPSILSKLLNKFKQFLKKI